MVRTASNLSLSIDTIGWSGNRHAQVQITGGSVSSIPEHRFRWVSDGSGRWAMDGGLIIGGWGSVDSIHAVTDYQPVGLSWL